MYTGRFKKGDKVRFVRSNNPADHRNRYLGNVFTIWKPYNVLFDRKPIGYLLEEIEPYFFREEELELVASAENELKFDWKNCVRDPKNRTAEIRFRIDPKDKKDAHRIAHEAVDSAIELYEKKKKACEWTLTELSVARHLLGELLADLVKKFDGDFFHFEVNPVMKSVRLIIAESKFIPVLGGGDALGFKTMKVYHAYPQNNDQFEENIGKLVCVCKALGKPIPVFIRDKNRRIEGDWIL